VQSIEIVFDEGTDNGGEGFAVLDNINIDGKILQP
jgi:hypothetical protein